MATLAVHIAVISWPWSNNPDHVLVFFRNTKYICIIVLKGPGCYVDCLLVLLMFANKSEENSKVVRSGIAAGTESVMAELLKVVSASASKEAKTDVHT